jgi:hypothetical protein
MVKGLVLGEVYLAAVRAFPQEEGAVLDLVLEFGVLGYVDASVNSHFVLLAAFAAWSEGFVDD